MPGSVRPSCDAESPLAYTTACTAETYGFSTTCSPESDAFFAPACQPGVYYWQDYDLVGEEWNNFFEVWDTLS